MRFVIPITCNEDNEPLGLFSVSTTAGELVLVFSDMDKWDRFAGAVSPLLDAENQSLGSATFDAESVDGLLNQLAESYPAAAEDAVFVPDSAPGVEEVMAYLEKRV